MTAAGTLGDGGFLPLGQLGWEFVLGIGVALFVGSLWALLRPGVVERRTGRKAPRPPDPARVRRNVYLGALIAIVGAVGLVRALTG